MTYRQLQSDKYICRHACGQALNAKSEKGCSLHLPAVPIGALQMCYQPMLYSLWLSTQQATPMTNL